MPVIIEPVGPPTPGEPSPPFGMRLVWFVALTLAGIVATAVVAYGLRWLLLRG